MVEGMPQPNRRKTQEGPQGERPTLDPDEIKIVKNLFEKGINYGRRHLMSTMLAAGAALPLAYITAPVITAQLVAAPDVSDAEIAQVEKRRAEIAKEKSEKGFLRSFFGRFGKNPDNSEIALWARLQKLRAAKTAREMARPYVDPFVLWVTTGLYGIILEDKIAVMLKNMELKQKDKKVESYLRHLARDVQGINTKLEALTSLMRASKKAGQEPDPKAVATIEKLGDRLAQIRTDLGGEEVSIEPESKTEK